MPLKDKMHPVDKFIIDARLNYLLRLCNSQPLKEYLIAEAKNEDEIVEGAYRFGYAKQPSDIQDVIVEIGAEDLSAETENEKQVNEVGRMKQERNRAKKGELALANVVLQHFEEVNGTSTPTVKIPVAQESEFIVVKRDGFTHQEEDDGHPIGRLVMEQAFPVLIFLISAVEGLIEDESMNKEQREAWLPLRCRGIVKQLEIQNWYNNEILLVIPDMETPPSVTLLERSYERLKDFPPSLPRDANDKYFGDGQIPFADLIFQPAYLGLRHIAAHHLLLKRCQREVCNQVFQAANRNEKYCSSRCKSAEKNARNRAGKRSGTYRMLASKLKSCGLVDNGSHFVEEEDVCECLGYPVNSLLQFFSKTNRVCFEKYNLKVEKHGSYEYAFLSISRN